ncbi:MAG TPA: hypothetical protein VFX48_00985, partial [Saprospiraceae bacterium]|nr:hypothetical protein [Saprospiraceae bacterium]
VWDQVRGLDEDYFMYGEDIDLSYKIRKAGYKNYYFPQTQIIHYKGESTSKGSLNYVVAFYQAMIIFARKHFAGSNKFALIGMLSAMVWLKALLSSIQSGIGRLRFVLLDLAFFISGFYAIRYYWAWWYHGRVDYFNHQAIHFNLGLFALIWAGSFYFQGVYDKKYALKDLLMAAIWGFAINLMFYALFPENWRSSRMLLVLSFFWVLAYALVSRLLHNRIRFRSWIIGSDFKRNTLVVGDQSQREKVQALLNPKLESFELHYEEPGEAIRFSTEHWKDYLRIHQIREIIFCQKNLDWKQIVGIMTGLKDEVAYKIMTESGTGIIGSSSRHDRGEIYSLDLEYNLSQRVYLRQKRLFDVLFSIVLLGFSWMLVFIYRNKRQFMTNLLQVGYGRYSWVSYQGPQESRRDLPMIKPGVLFPVEAVEHLLTPELEAQLLTMYAWNYSVWSDLGICLRDFQRLDQIPYGSIH